MGGLGYGRLGQLLPQPRDARPARCRRRGGRAPHSPTCPRNFGEHKQRCKLLAPGLRSTRRRPGTVQRRTALARASQGHPAGTIRAHGPVSSSPAVPADDAPLFAPLGRNHPERKRTPRRAGRSCWCCFLLVGRFGASRFSSLFLFVFLCSPTLVRSG